MLTVYNCIITEHDLRLVVLAGLTCLIASLTAVNLLHHVGKARRHMRHVWTAVSAMAIGSGVWATHFIGMLAFQPGVPNGYDLGLTLASLLVAVVVTGGGIAVAITRPNVDNRLVGGAIIGAGIAVMHYIGMAAFQVQGVMAWDQLLVAASLVTGVGLGALSVFVALRSDTILSRIVGALVLTLAICGMHFTGMGAVSILPDASIAVPASAIPAPLLAGAVAAASFIILLLVCTALWVDVRDYRNAEKEAARMHNLADAAIEGLLVCGGTRLVTANASFMALTDWTPDILAGRHLADLFPDKDVCSSLLDGSQEIFETELVINDGNSIPVELLSRFIDYGGTPHLVVAVRDIRERKAAEADIRRLAMHDALTGLPNRRAFSARLDEEILAAGNTDGHLALLCLDLDRFKEVNDLFGHAAGDVMLKKVARCVSGALGEGQMLARLGGDEFAIVAPRLQRPEDASRIAEAILRSFREENEDASSEGLMSTSIGIALFPADARDREALLSNADAALYRAKSEGRDTWRFYEEAMGMEARARRLMEHELRHAVARNEFRLVYQPQKKLDTGETIGFEALLRWSNAERGNVSPAVFVPIAEESGIIVPIGEWVLRTACEEAATWQKPVTIAVNVSAIQLHSPSFVHTVHEILLQTGLSPSRLEIEITETALVRDMTRALTTLRQLKALGVHIAMDDFGTGYSSLSNLRAFPFDKIKIDGSFIKQVDTNEQAATIVKAVLGIGRGLGLPVLAEGVETSEELKFLAGEFCQIGQGYLLGRPGPIASLDEGSEAEQARESDAA
ncbi:EAL domain-containing protein [Nitratireductor sp. CAU 1489]|uniref:EAL domain-containing protein n=1 Tax=Nitratireductor arenosus TaxID=2682096 RepID=A0A844QGE1_9HYPH|nr:EAL domain-containing protein [Nitratireductor arenosus]MVA97051.1 EAL domain-containing protein [Nitratireductor arenosus]